ncbi:hypothetical protein H8693_08190 [Christensenellaceae bacterium NSJ-63]|uniref:Uncharacterized protein n=1 Tax=Guopingia tenuis TaxID=2763656 RepID=A0A926DJJ5_9FIRM|nr:DUF6709 family protein [Guopingia tenuis]MBC8538914.1 hypothetical protein [Guopingia tenuis]
MISIPYLYFIYRESVLATIVSLLGTICWIAAAVLLIELHLVYSAVLIILAVFFTICWAPYIAACRAAKKEGLLLTRRSPREFIRSTRKTLLLFSGLFLVLAGTCLYTILSNDAVFARQQEAMPIEELYITDLTEGQYVEGELFSFISGIAYEGETEETATKYYALLLMADGVNTPVCYPVELPGAKWKNGDAIMDAFYSYWTNPDAEFYQGEAISFFGSLQPVSALDPDIQRYYQEALDNCGTADWRGDLYFRAETPLSTSANDIYDIILYGSSAIAILLLCLAIWGFFQENLARKTI